MLPHPPGWRRPLLGAATAALCGLASAGAPAADTAPAPPPDLGPLGLRTQGTLRELFLDVTLADARAVERASLELRYSVSNVWNESMDLARGADGAHQELDEQADSLGVRLTLPWSALAAGPELRLPGSVRPLFARLSTAVELKATEHWGGWSDGPIEAWHGLIGAFNFHRDRHPRDRIHLHLSDAGGSAFDLDHPVLGLGDVALRTQFLLAEDAAGSSALALRIDLKAPTGRLALASGSGGFDAALGLLGTWQASSGIALHALAAISRLGGFGRPLLQQPRPWHFTAAAAAAFAAGPLQLLIEDRVVSALLESGWERLEAGGNDGLLSSGYFASFRPHNQISLGARAGRFTLWLSEDFTPGSNPRSRVPFYYESNSPDVTVGVRFLQAL